MKNNTKFNLQLFADGEPQGGEGTQNPIDYKAEYEKAIAERDAYKSDAEKQKGLKDKYASENAEYKKKEIANMSEADKKAQEYNDLVESTKKMQEQIATYELKETLLSNGFNAEEVKELIENKCSPETYAKIWKAREEALKKSLNAEAIANLQKDSNLGVGSTKDPANTKSDFAKFQEEVNKKDTSGRVEF